MEIDQDNQIDQYRLAILRRRLEPVLTNGLYRSLVECRSGGRLSIGLPHSAVSVDRARDSDSATATALTLQVRVFCIYPMHNPGMGHALSPNFCLGLRSAHIGIVWAIAIALPEPA